MSFAMAGCLRCVKCATGMGIIGFHDDLGEWIVFEGFAPWIDSSAQ